MTKPLDEPMTDSAASYGVRANGGALDLNLPAYSVFYDIPGPALGPKVVATNIWFPEQSSAYLTHDLEAAIRLARAFRKRHDVKTAVIRTYGEDTGRCVWVSTLED